MTAVPIEGAGAATIGYRHEHFEPEAARDTAGTSPYTCSIRHTSKTAAALATVRPGCGCPRGVHSCKQQPGLAPHMRLLGRLDKGSMMLFTVTGTDNQQFYPLAVCTGHPALKLA